MDAAHGGASFALAATGVPDFVRGFVIAPKDGLDGAVLMTERLERSLQ